MSRRSGGMSEKNWNDESSRDESNDASATERLVFFSIKCLWFLVKSTLRIDISSLYLDEWWLSF